MTTEQGVAGKRRRTPAEIEQIVREFANSGLNRSQFCRQHGLTLGVLNRGLQRLPAGNAPGGSGDGLVRVELANNEPAESWGLTVVLARGRKIAVNPGFHDATLERLVHVLETM